MGSLEKLKQGQQIVKALRIKMTDKIPKVMNIETK